MDDIVVFSTEGELQCIKETAKVIQKLKEDGWTINISKVQLARTTIMTLGYEVALNRISVPKLKLQGFICWPRPKSNKELRTFICSISYYRHTIKNFSHEIHDLLELANITNPDRGKNKPIIPFVWKEIHEKCFIKMKQLLAKNNSMRIPDYSKPLILTVDASKVGLGLSVWQNDADNKRILICAFSRVLNVHEKRYSAHKLETLSIVAGITAFDMILRGGKNCIGNRCKIPGIREAQ